jgi:hypothetical protein
MSEGEISQKLQRSTIGHWQLLALGIPPTMARKLHVTSQHILLLSIGRLLVAAHLESITTPIEAPYLSMV